MEGSAAISENLKIVEVKFEVADEGVLKVLIFLQTLNIGFAFYISANLWSYLKLKQAEEESPEFVRKLSNKK